VFISPGLTNFAGAGCAGSARAKRVGSPNRAVTIKVRKGKVASGLKKPGARRRIVMD
jgi:hypothetical protein